MLVNDSGEVLLIMPPGSARDNNMGVAVNNLSFAETRAPNFRKNSGGTRDISECLYQIICRATHVSTLALSIKYS